MVFETIAFTDYAIRARGDDSLSACLSYGFAGAWRVADAADGGSSCWRASGRPRPPSVNARWQRTNGRTGPRPLSDARRHSDDLERPRGNPTRDDGAAPEGRARLEHAADRLHPVAHVLDVGAPRQPGRVDAGAVVDHRERELIDGSAWWWGLVGGVTRSAVLTGLAAALGASLAMIGRNTAVALGAAFVYLNVVEGVLRAWKPWLGRCFISEKPPSS